MKKFIYNRKLLDNKLFRVFIMVSVRCSHFFDYMKDKKICGCSLVKYVPSKYRETLGATGSQATCYWALDEIFLDDKISDNDKFVDVGCGKGRVFAYLLRRGVKCDMTGVELNSDVAEYARKWARRYDNITILNENAFDLDYNKYTIMFLGRPFETETFYRFIEKLEQSLRHPVRFYYWWDTQSGSYLENRAGWTMRRRKWVFTSHGFFMFGWPQRYTLWDYVPQNSGE